MTDGTNITYGYHHLESGHPDNRSKYRICGTRTRQATSNPVCHRPAGWGTSHPGVGRCKLHGGCSPSGPDHPNWRSGRYADKFRGRLEQHYKDHADADKNPLDLLPELTVQRVILSMALQSLVDKATVIPNGNITSDYDYERETAETVGDGGARTLTEKGYQADDAVSQFLTNHDIRLVSELTNDIVDTVTKINTLHNKTALTKTEVSYLLTKLKQGMDRFVPKENRAPFIKWLMDEFADNAENGSSLD